MCIEMLYALSYELWIMQSHECKTIKGDELMRDKLMCGKYCDGNHYGNPTSLITLRHDKIKLFWE